ncbi:MAG: tRNA preQ1(34) S-adenosylmethionine ribosyltransferase-isomerase QueA [Clostridiales bacterium]|nr:tRNA preQ1(34) S-adenosylmethionine ribosyltransferase-isomerase QueA [Clostridiales bacterium]
MKTKDFWYELPPELIAQTPCAQRDGSRLLRLDRASGATEHTMFRSLPDFLRPGDCLVFNDSRVIQARLIGERSGGGTAEILLLKPLADGCWECLAKPGRKLRPGAVVTFGEGLMTAEIVSCGEEGLRTVRLSCEGDFDELLQKLGKTPLPPYIKEELDDPERYQTVYSKNPGSAAAPTAGLHFTPEIFSRLSKIGVKTAFLTLHVGIGTFRPVKEEDISEHKMHTESYCVTPECAETVNSARASGGRIIAVGTTSCRVLESVADEKGFIPACSGETNIFLYPGCRFRAIDGLLTNFHLPESTLIMLVSAFAGKDNVLAAYREAVREKYRFFSFGDAMLIL